MCTATYMCTPLKDFLFWRQKKCVYPPISVRHLKKKMCTATYCRTGYLTLGVNGYLTTTKRVLRLYIATHLLNKRMHLNH